MSETLYWMNKYYLKFSFSRYFFFTYVRLCVCVCVFVWVCVCPYVYVSLCMHNYEHMYVCTKPFRYKQDVTKGQYNLFERIVFLLVDMLL